MNSLTLLLGSLCSVALADTTALQERVSAFLQPRRQTIAADVVDPSALERILARVDPGTFFLYYAFGLQKHAQTLLDEDQARRLAEVLRRHTPEHRRWHDERNTLRAKYNALLWRYVAAPDAEAPTLRRELEGWMKLRMEWTRQEHLAQYRFARDVWNVLRADQQAKLLSGQWKRYAKQDTGHTRADATARIITRALGKPDHKEAFDAAVAAWTKDRVPLHAALAAQELRERRIVFAMDLNSAALADQANTAANEAFSRLYLAEADALRRIVQAGYTRPAVQCAAAAAEAWSEARQRFQEGAIELIQLLEQP